MTTIRWSQTGATPRGTPAFRRALRRHPVFMALLTAAAIFQTGCQSCGVSPCASFGNGVRNLSERAFRPIKNVLNGNGLCCGSGIGVEAPAVMPYGGSSVVVSPATPSGIITTPGTTDTIPSSPNLEPIPERTPSATPGPPADTTPSQGARSSTGKANYEAMRPSLRNLTRPRAVVQSNVASRSPEPTPRSALGPAAKSAVAKPDPLDDLPPLELPQGDAATVTPPTSPAASATPRPAETSASTEQALADMAARGVSAETTVAPGIRRFAGVESKLAGGSLPDVNGLDWLAEKGYKTILDLREEADISPTFINEVSRRGMRYLALPIDANHLDADHVARFNFEVSLSDARPLYFFDTDGTRAGAMWYIRRITVDKVDELIARRDAEEIGLSDRKFWLAAGAFLAAPTPAPDRIPAPAAPNAGTIALPPVPLPVDPKSASNAGSNAPKAPSAGPGPGRPA